MAQAAQSEQPGAPLPPGERYDAMMLSVDGEVESQPAQVALTGGGRDALRRRSRPATSVVTCEVAGEIVTHEGGTPPRLLEVRGVVADLPTYLPTYNKPVFCPRRS